MNEIFRNIISMGKDIIGSTILDMLIEVIYMVTYPLYVYGLYKLAKRKDIKYRWMAFVPILNNYILVSIAGEVLIGKRRIPELQYLLPILAFLASQPIPIVGAVTNLIFVILYWITIHRVYEIYKPEKADLYLILGIISECLTPAFVFSIRNSNKTYSKLVVDDDGDGKFDREIQTLDTGENIVRELQGEEKNKYCECGETIDETCFFCESCGKKVS